MSELKRSMAKWASAGIIPALMGEGGAGAAAAAVAAATGGLPPAPPAPTPPGPGPAAPTGGGGGGDGGGTTPGGGGGGGGSGDIGGTLKWLGDISTLPFQQVEQLRDLQQAEQSRDIATSGAGMSDATRENLVQYFTELGLGITPEVDQAVTDMSTSMAVDWSDPLTVDTIFGTYDPQRGEQRTHGVLSKALMNGGQPLVASVMQGLKQFYEIANQNPTFNRSEMIEILHHWLNGDMDPTVLAVKTRAFLDTATRDSSDPLAALGITDPAAAERSRKARMIFQGVLGAISERPDMSQIPAAMGERQFQRMRQQDFRAWEAMARRMGVPVYKAMEMASQWSGKAANYLGDFSDSGLNAAFALTANPWIQAGSLYDMAYLPVGQTGRGLSGYQPLETMPQFSQVPNIGPGRMASTDDGKDRFVRVAQSQMWNPSISGGEIVPMGGHQGHDAQLAAMQQDMQRMMGTENSMAADAAELSYAQLIGKERTIQLRNLEANVSRLQQDLSAYDEDIRTGRGAADLRLIDTVNAMSGELAGAYGELLGLYDEMIRMAEVKVRSVQQAAMFTGVDPYNDQNSRYWQMISNGVAAKRKEVAIQRNMWMLKSRKMGEDLRIQAREVMSVQPLRTMRDVLREGYGADPGASLALASEEMAQARSRMEQYNKLRGLDPNVGGVQAGHALNQAYQHYLSAIRDIDRSAQPALQPGQQAEILGV